MLRRTLAGSASFVCLRCRLRLTGAANRLRLPPPALPSSAFGGARRYIGTRDVPAASEEAGSQSEPQSTPQTPQTSQTPPAEQPAQTEGTSTTEPTKSTKEPIAPIEPTIQLDQTSQLEQSGRTEQPKQAAYNEPGEPSTEPFVLPEGYLEEDPLLKPKRFKKPKKYKARTRILAPERAGLPIDILGQPGAAIILKEEKRIRRKNFEDIQADEGTENKVDPTTLLPNEASGDPALQDILLNIHELKPKDREVLTEAEFMELKKTLMNGFTSAQLVDYIQEYLETRKLLASEEQAPERPPWLLELRPWVPAVENAIQDVDPQLDGYITASMTPKERLAIRLMRQCWNLSYQEIQQRPGYLIFRLRKVEFTLLTRGNKRWLEGAPRAILRTVNQVRMIRESQHISIMAPKYAAEVILDRVNRILSNTRTAEFNATHVCAPEALVPAVLEEVGSVTNTVVRYDRSGEKIAVSWTHNPDRPEDLETADQTVLRFLRDAYGVKPREASSLEVIPQNLENNGRYVTVLDCGKKLSWQQRSKIWGRWTTPVPLASESSAKPDQPLNIPEKALRFAWDAVNAKSSEQESTTKSPDGWSSHLRTDTSAVFGQVVFAQKQAMLQKSSAPGATQLDRSLERAFVPFLPPLGTLDLPTNLREEGLWHTTIVIRFVPSPTLSPDLLESAPNLELRIEADHREIKRLKDLRAVTDIFTNDVLFPSAAVDTRLVQQRYFVLPGEQIENHATPIIDFLGKANLRPWDGKLITPTFVPKIRLPRRVFSPVDSSNDAATPKQQASSGEEGFIELDYNLASVEMQRTVTAEYLGLKLRYTSIQAGQRGGERAELSLEAVRITPEELDRLKQEEEARRRAQRQAKAREENLDDEEDGEGTIHRSKFERHVLNDPTRALSPITGPPAAVREFLDTVVRIAEGEDRLKWQLKTPQL